MSTSSAFLPPLPDETRLVRNWYTSGALHLVGGAVRDWLLRRPLHDLDFVVPQGAIAFARQVAQRLNAAFFVLDPRREVARVLLPPAPTRTVRVLDFAVYRGPTLEADLRLRDFTINAMAIDPLTPERLIDPLRGLQDLKDQVLRLAYARALHDDPLRVLRAVRLALTLEFRLADETRQALPQAAPRLQQVAAERRCEELFRLLMHPKAAAALRVLARVGALRFIWPELDALRQQPPLAAGEPRPWEQALAAGEYVHRLAQALAVPYKPADAANFALGLVSWRLGRFRQALAEHWQRSLHTHRPAQALTVWAGFYHNVAFAAGTTDLQRARHSARLARQRARALRLSRAETQHLGRSIEQHAQVVRWAETGALPTPRQIYRFFRAAGPAGVDAVLVALAVGLARHSLAPPHALWEQYVAVARRLWEAWWEQREQLVTPPRLLRGDEIATLLGYPPGPWVGQALRALAEAQVMGEVHTREQAADWLRAWAQRHLTPPANGQEATSA